MKRAIAAYRAWAEDSVWPDLIGGMVLMLLFTAAMIWAKEARSAEIVIGPATRISDGDTLWVGKTKIRLCGIDAPERGRPGYAEATGYLAQITRGKTLRCIVVGSGSVCDGRSKRKNGDRLVAQCSAGGVDLAQIIVKAGHACDWRRFSGRQYAQIGGCSRP